MEKPAAAGAIVATAFAPAPIPGIAASRGLGEAAIR